MPSSVDDVLPPAAALAADPNGDGRITLGDAPSWLAHLFFLPGDWALWATPKYAPPLASLLGEGAPDYGGFVSGFIAAVFWSLAFILLGTAYAYVVEFDRRATRASARLLDGMRRILRVAARLLRARFRRGEPREAGGGTLEFSTQVDLDALETRVLLELANLAPGYAAAARELSQALRLRADEVRAPLEALAERRLVCTLGGAEGESGYALSAAGRAALLMRQLAPRSDDRRSVDEGSPRS